MAHLNTKSSFFYQLVVGVTVSMWLLMYVVLTYWYYSI